MCNMLVTKPNSFESVFSYNLDHPYLKVFVFLSFIYFDLGAGNQAQDFRNSRQVLYHYVSHIPDGDFLSQDLFVFLCICLYAMYVQMPWEAGRGCWLPRTGVSGDCELPNIGARS